MKDALGNEIEIGQLYGYSNRSNGICSIVVGVVTKFTKQGVTLDIKYRGSSIYGKNVEEVLEDGWRTRSWVNVVANTIFPVYDEVSWEKSGE